MKANYVWTNENHTSYTPQSAKGEPNISKNPAQGHKNSPSDAKVVKNGYTG
jgi:hypothetical protein